MLTVIARYRKMENGNKPSLSISLVYARKCNKISKIKKVNKK